MLNSKILTKKVETKESIGERNELVKLIDEDVNLIVLVDYKTSKAKQFETEYKYGLFSGTVICSDTEDWNVGDYSSKFSKGRFKRIENEISISFFFDNEKTSNVNQKTMLIPSVDFPTFHSRIVKLENNGFNVIKTENDKFYCKKN